MEQIKEEDTFIDIRPIIQMTTIKHLQE